MEGAGVGGAAGDEYGECIERDAGVERRFQEVLGAEPGVEETMAILRGLRERYEPLHHVQSSDPEMVQAAT